MEKWERKNEMYENEAPNMNLLNIEDSININKDSGAEVERKNYPNRKRSEKKNKTNIVIFCGWNFVYYSESGGIGGQSKRKRKQKINERKITEFECEEMNTIEPHKRL